MHHSQFALAYPIAMSLAAGAMMPLVLIALSHPPLRINSAGLRIGAAAVVSLLLWAGLLLAGHVWRPASVLLMGDVAAGVLFMATAALATYSAWALVAFGYTLSMLVDIARTGKPVTTAEWKAAYGTNHGLRAMFEDRLRVLLGFGFVQTKGNGISLSGAFGRVFAKLVFRFMRIALGGRT